MDKTLSKLLSKLFELRKKPLTIPAKYTSYVLPFLAKITAKFSKIFLPIKNKNDCHNFQNVPPNLLKNPIFHHKNRQSQPQ
jgi:hypothetical protein